MGFKTSTPIIPDAGLDAAGVQALIDDSPLRPLQLQTRSAAFTLALPDAQTSIGQTSGSATNATVPSNATVAFPVGTAIDIRQDGSGIVTAVAASGVTFTAPFGVSTSGAGTSLELTKLATNAWLVMPRFAAGAAGGALSSVATAATADATLADSVHTPVDASGAARAMTLPTGVAAGKLLSVEKTDSSANTVTVSGTIRGAAGSLTLRLNRETVLLLSEGAGSWRPIADHKTLSALDGRFPTKTSGRRFDPRDYGAKADGRLLTDVISPGSGDATISSASYSFTAADVGKIIGVELPLGSLPDAWITTIQSVSGGVATLATAAPSSIVANTALECVFGTNDDAAVLAAMNAAAPVAASGMPGGTVVLPTGRMCVQATLPLLDGVSWEGYGREVSIVAVIKNTGGATAASAASWMVSPQGAGLDPRLTGCTFRDFKIEGRFHTTTIYQSSTKPFNLYTVRRVYVHNMWLDRTPATAIPCDQGSVACQITNNLVTGPGRMNDGTSPGGSGIGMGTRTDGAVEPTLVGFNSIIGDGTHGVNGIFTEAQNGATVANAPVGYRFIGNYIEGMKYGITGAGTRGLVIASNVINKCYMAGIALSNGTLSAGFADESFNIHGNVVCNGVTTIGGTTSANAEGHGILIDLTKSGGQTSQGRGLIANNMVFGNRGNGLQVRLFDNNTNQLTVRGNSFRSNGLSGIRTVNPNAGGAVMRKSQFESNAINDNGTRGISGDNHGIALGVSANDLDVKNNTCWDDQGTTTQAYGIAVLSGVTLTNGSIRDNDVRNNKTGGITVSGTISDTTWVARNAGAAPRTPTTVTATASPMTYAAPAIPTTLFINGGTVTALTVAGVSIDPASKTLPLEPSDSVVITYSSAPTLTTRPR